MKRLIKDTESIEFNIIMELSILDSILAAFDPSISENELHTELDEILEDDYEAFIGLLSQRLKDFGFEVLEPIRKSNHKDSKSRYFVLCRMDEYQELQVKLIIYLRISDHRLSKRKGSDKSWDHHEATKTFHNTDVENYRFLNEKNPQLVKAWDLSIIVNGNKFSTYESAIRHVLNRLSPYLNECED